MTYRELYDYGLGQLTKACIAEAQLDARLLLEYICRTDRNTLLVHGDRIVSGIEEEFYRAAIDKRAKHIPLQHITGEQEFMGLCFRVNEHTLIPRQDTEILVEEAMRYMGDGMRILDLCTGSGCILLSLLKYSNECEGIGTDISDKALKTACENADALGLDAAFLEGSLYEPLAAYKSKRTNDTLFDIIVSNPPYIESAEIETLMPEVRDFEPRIALDGGSDGLDFYRRIIEEAPVHMRKGAMIFLEIGYDQAAAVSGLLKDRGFSDIEIVKDYSGNDRVALAVWRQGAKQIIG